MASAAIFSSLRRRRSPSLEAFLAPVHLNELTLVQTLASVSSELVSVFSSRSFAFQKRNSRTLLQRISIFMTLFEFMRDSTAEESPVSSSSISSTTVVCLKEIYLLLYRSKILLDHCLHSSKLWLLLQNSSLSAHFHDLNQEISTILDVLPLPEICSTSDVLEQVDLLRRQTRRAKLFVDSRDEKLRANLFSFLELFEKGRLPDPVELQAVFVSHLGISTPAMCRNEIEFLEEQIYSHEGDVEPAGAVINGFIAVTRYCRFLLFGFEEEEMGMGDVRRTRKGLVCREIGQTFLTVPKDFCCPISLELMEDPVIVSTGQTYDRCSISRWLEEGHCSCPKTGQMLAHTRLVPNRALRSLIAQWCTAHGVPYEAVENADFTSLAASTRAVVEANKATAELLIQQLERGSQGGKTVAARELRLLAKTGKENRACIAEAGAIPLLRRLLPSPNPIAQENSVTAILNLSIHDKNKSRIMEEVGCLGAIVEVLRFGLTTEARENAAATLFSLSAVHDYKKRICEEEGAVEALVGLLRDGSARGKKDAVTALFNLSTHADNCRRMMESGAVTALVEALETEGVAEEAAGALALLVRQPLGAEAVGKEESAVTNLLAMMRRGTPRGKENAVAALLELCRSGGTATTQRVIRAPALASLLQALLFTGTKRARRKAASLARVCQRCEASALPVGRGWGAAYAFSRASAAASRASFTADVSVPVSISVPVL